MDKTQMLKAVERTSKPIWITGGVILLCGVGLLDYLTGNELSFSLFYLIPIAIITWMTNGKTGIAIAIISAGIWFLAEVSTGAAYANPIIYGWNTAIRLGYFLIMVLLINLGKSLERERTFSRTDFLTGTINNRFFYELAQREIDRSIRYQHPLAVAYIDVDDFKSINDRFGHATGDKTLVVIANCVRRHLRKTDIVARVGGDEFVILLPEISVDDAQNLLTKVQHLLVDEMRNNHWNVTFSIGVLRFEVPPVNVDDLLNMADQAMYSVKNRGKNNISFVAQLGGSALKEKGCL